MLAQGEQVSCLLPGQAPGQGLPCYPLLPPGQGNKVFGILHPLLSLIQDMSRGLNPYSGYRSIDGVGNGNLLQYSCLEPVGLHPWSCRVSDMTKAT